jgi:hypothetical protein
MKTKLLLLALMVSAFTVEMQAQDRTIINAKNSEISDNLDLRAVASIFGDSRNLQDFERRLNDPKLQISNLDLNNDDEVDYLRVIESVEKRTHVIIIQAVLDRDVYQDIATIDVEKDRYNNIHIQVVGDVYMYGRNYIYEPVYHSTPLIYASFWVSNYRPYCSAWDWGYYPSYYYSWNPFPVFRYRNNISLCLNINNNYNYVNYRRSDRAAYIYNSRRSNGYERQHPDYSFSRRNSDVNNRYELDQRRVSRNVGSRNEIGYSQNRTGYQRGNSPQRTESTRDYSQNRIDSQRGNSPQRTESPRDYSQNRIDSQRGNSPQRMESTRDYSQNRVESQRGNSPQRTESTRDNSQNRIDSQRGNSSQRTESTRDYSQNRVESQRGNSPQRTESTRDYSQNRVESQRGNSPQRMESPRESMPQRTESQRGNSPSRNRNERS